LNGVENGCNIDKHLDKVWLELTAEKAWKYLEKPVFFILVGYGFPPFESNFIHLLKIGFACKYK